MKKFDLQAALAGAPCRTRAGRKAFIRHHESELELHANSQILGYIDTVVGWHPYSWTCLGFAGVSGGGLEADIIGMWEPEFKHWYLFDPCVVSLTVSTGCMGDSYKLLLAETRNGGMYAVHLEDRLITDPVGTVYTR